MRMFNPSLPMKSQCSPAIALVITAYTEAAQRNPKAAARHFYSTADMVRSLEREPSATWPWCEHVDLLDSIIATPGVDGPEFDVECTDCALSFHVSETITVAARVVCADCADCYDCV